MATLHPILLFFFWFTGFYYYSYNKGYFQRRQAKWGGIFPRDCAAGVLRLLLECHTIGLKYTNHATEIKFFFLSVCIVIPCKRVLMYRTWHRGENHQSCQIEVPMLDWFQHGDPQLDRTGINELLNYNIMITSSSRKKNMHRQHFHISSSPVSNGGRILACMWVFVCRLHVWRTSGTSNDGGVQISTLNLPFKSKWSFYIANVKLKK